MKDILEKANEIGNMIQSTEVYRNYVTSQEKLNTTVKSLSLYTEYQKISSEILNRQSSGDQVYDYEFEELRELADAVKNDTIIEEFIVAHSEYLKLMESIQEALTIK